MKRNFTNISLFAIVLGGTAVSTIIYDLTSEEPISIYEILGLAGTMLVAWLIIVGIKALIGKLVKFGRREKKLV